MGRRAPRDRVALRNRKGREMRTIQYIGVGIVAVALTAETVARMLREMKEWKPTGGNQ